MGGGEGADISMNDNLLMCASKAGEACIHVCMHMFVAMLWSTILIILCCHVLFPFSEVQMIVLANIATMSAERPVSGISIIFNIHVLVHVPLLLPTYSTAHVKGKCYTHFSCRIHAGYAQIDNTFHTYDYHGVCGLHATRHTCMENQHPCSQQKSFVL